MPSSSIRVIEPFPWATMLRYLSLRSTPGLETIEPDRYTRTTADGLVRVTYDGGHLRVTGGSIDRIRRIFHPDGDVSAVARVLKTCPLLGPRLRALPGMRPPGCWEPFELCTRVILGQQVSVKAAHTLMVRLAALCPTYAPAQVAAADLRAIGVTTRRADTLRLLATAFAVGAINVDGQPWPETARVLREIPGIGPWTTSYLGIRLGRDPDAFPESDLGLINATGAASPKELLKLAERWRPYRGYAAMYLWTNTDANAG